VFNTYTYKSFDYNSNLFFPNFGYSTDDGVFLGVGLSRITYGFKKGPCLRGEPCYNSAPYASRQSFGFDVAPGTGSFYFFYNGDFTDVIGKLDLNITARVQAPNYRYNFFGYGNETQINDSINIKDYRIHLNQALLFPALETGSANTIRFLFGPIYQQARVKEQADSSFFSDFPDLTAGNLERKNFLGANTQLFFDPVSFGHVRKFGIRFLINVGYLKELEDTTEGFGFVRGNVSLYYFLRNRRGIPVLTLATRFGGGHNQGSYEFYQANIIGGRTNENVRGYLGERFNGRSSLYNNFEARLRLFHFNAYIFPADFGIIGLVDNGRVWVDNEQSNTWHTGYGGGIWFSPFSLAVLTATYSFSNDQSNGLLNVRLGWWF
jgi:hypothetical protein